MPNVLKDKSYKTYNYLSRYSTFPYFYQSVDKKYVYGVTNWLNTDTLYQVYIAQKGDTLDSIALQSYNDPCKYWIIADFNRILNPLITFEGGESLKIPDISNIEFMLKR